MTLLLFELFRVFFLLFFILVVTIELHLFFPKIIPFLHNKKHEYMEYISHDEAITSPTRECSSLAIFSAPLLQYHSLYTSPLLGQGSARSSRKLMGGPLVSMRRCSAMHVVFDSASVYVVHCRHSTKPFNSFNRLLTEKESDRPVS